MAVDLQRSFKTLLFPALLFIPVVLLQSLFAEQLDSLGSLAVRLPYIILITGLALAMLFHHSREFLNLLILLLGCALLDYFIWQSPTHPHASMIYNLLALLVPLNLLINDLWRERGILNRHGLLRIVVIVIQFALAAWLLHIAPRQLEMLSHYGPAFVITDTPLPPLTQGSILLCGIILLIYVFTHPSTLQGSLFFTFITLVFALHFVEQPHVARVYLLLAGLLILLSLLLNLRRLAYYDELTQLPSRRALRQALLAQGHRYSIAMVDVDHFKKLNDRYGHDVGDQVLRMLATQLNRVKGGKAFRYGGEEFTLLFPGKLSDEAQNALEQLRATVADKPFQVRHKRSRPRKRPDNPPSAKPTPTLNVSISIGAADTTCSDDPQVIMKRADQALYQAKKKGRNRVVVTG